MGPYIFIKIVSLISLLWFPLLKANYCLQGAKKKEERASWDREVKFPHTSIMNEVDMKCWEVYL